MRSIIAIAASVLRVPRITSITPDIGTTAGSVAVTIRGNNLRGIGTAGNLRLTSSAGEAFTSVVVASDGRSATAVTPAKALGTYALWCENAWNRTCTTAAIYDSWDPAAGGASEWWDVTAGTTVGAGILTGWVGRVHGLNMTTDAGPAWTAANIGGLACPRFNGTSQRMWIASKTTADVLTATDGLVVIVYRPISITLDAAAWYANDSLVGDNGPGWGINLKSSVGAIAGIYNATNYTASSAVTIGTAEIRTWRHLATTTLGTRRNNAAEVTSTGASVGTTGVVYLANGWGAKWANVDVGDVVFFKVGVLATETLCRRFLNAKFGVY